MGLDTVALIEGHFAERRCLSMDKTVDYLKKTYLDHGKLGAKSPKGGFYPPVTANGPKLLVLDTGWPDLFPLCLLFRLLERFWR